MQLTQDAFGQAREFLMTQGRPLEQALFRHFFESGPVEDIFDALAKHQADNGGFFDMGEGGIDGPTPIGSTIAFQYFREFGITSQSPLVRNGIRYFLDTYDHTHEIWPRRPGMPVADVEPEKWANPGAEIIAYLWLYRELVPPDFLAEATEHAMTMLRKATPPIYEFADMCFLRLADFLEPPQQQEIMEKVTAGIWENLQLDHEKWQTNYFVKPYWYAMTPQAPLYPMLADEIDACLNFEVETQEPEGYFKLTWSISGRAREIWKSIWTLEVLRVLDTFGRIEGRGA